MTTERFGGTARERATVVSMVLLGVTLPVVANLTLFQNVVWLFWLAALTLIVVALTLLVRINRRERSSREP